MKECKYDTLAKVVGKFRKKKVMVLGDLMLDQFVRGEVSRISPEAPIPVVWVRDDNIMPGGACNVACNMAKLGAEVYLVGVVGDDENGVKLRTSLSDKWGVTNVDGIIPDKERATIVKTRVIAHHQQVVRIDREDLHPISGKIMDKVFDFIRKNIDNVDALLIEDYGKGLITPEIQKIVSLARRKKKIIAVDPKESHFSYYKGATVITPNVVEATSAVRLAKNDPSFSMDDDASLLRGGEILLKKYNCNILLVTLGERGMMVFRKGVRPKIIPTVAQEVFDVSGAGDTVIATYTLALAARAYPTSAAHIANCAAGIVVGREGTAVVSPRELLERLKLEIERAGGK